MLTMKLPTNDGNIRGLNVLSSHLNNNANFSPVEPQSISRIFGRPVDLQADELCVFFYRRTAPSCAAANRVGQKNSGILHTRKNPRKKSQKYVPERLSSLPHSLCLHREEIDNELC